MNSKRLPKKALLELNGVPAIERCLLNTLASKYSAMTILATSTEADDVELKKHTLEDKVKFFTGSANDPALRMYDAAKLNGLDYIVRVTGDSPAISYELIDLLIESHIRNKVEFSYYKDAPLGARPEVISTKAIKKLKTLINTDGYSEYLSIYFKNNPEHFKLNEVLVPKKYRFPQYRLNLDYPQDYELLKNIYEELNICAKPLSLTKIIEFFQNHPEKAEINNGIKPKYLDGEFAEFINKITKIKDKTTD
jgi:N,N'-diacetyllegionaminate synthase